MAVHAASPDGVAAVGPGALAPWGESRFTRHRALATLTYRSRAIRPVGEPELQALLHGAQVRNRQEGLTGLLIYDHGRFVQWLEGPPDALRRVWQSIRRDPRHTDIELLGESTTPTRLFADWTLKLAVRCPSADLTGHSEALDIPPELIETLYRSPTIPSSLLGLLAPAPGLRAALVDVLGQYVIPQLVVRHGPRVQPVPGSAAALARLLVASDPAEALGRLAALQMPRESLGGLCSRVFEPVARSLGDLWQDDDCSEFDVTLGMCRLQGALRRLIPTHPVIAHGASRAVLVAPQPGEPHMLGAALDAEVLWQSGWLTHCETPATDQALQELLADTWFDALDLTLSSAFQREHWLPRMAATIAGARHASRNPDLVVVVGGRVFAERDGAGRRVGADAASRGARQTGPRIEQLLRAQS